MTPFTFVVLQVERETVMTLILELLPLLCGVTNFLVIGAIFGFIYIWAIAYRIWSYGIRLIGDGI